MHFSPPDYTFDDFEAATNRALSQFGFISYAACEVEDSVPWVNIVATRVIKPREAAAILTCLQANIIDEVLFNSLSGKELRIVVNGKFHFTPDELTAGSGFDDTYAHEFGMGIEDMKKEYGI